jgi:hypothetical protein
MFISLILKLFISLKFITLNIKRSNISTWREWASILFVWTSRMSFRPWRSFVSESEWMNVFQRKGMSFVSWMRFREREPASFHECVSVSTLTRRKSSRCCEWGYGSPLSRNKLTTEGIINLWVCDRNQPNGKD